MCVELPARVADNIEHLVGRDWLLKPLEDWWNRRDQRLLVIVGKPGAGKSMVLGWLAGFGPEPSDPVARQRLAHLRSTVTASYFFQAAGRNVSRESFVNSIINQLKSKIPELAAALAEKAHIVGKAHVSNAGAGTKVAGVMIDRFDVGSFDDELFERAFVSPLKALYSRGYAEPMLLLIDALDEAQTDRGLTIPYLLARLANLPAPVRILAATRDEPRVLKFFHRSATFDLIRDASPDVDDIRLYALARLKSAAIADGKHCERFAKRLSKQSAGVFLYAALVLDDLLAQPQTTLQDIDLESLSLPDDLNEIYTEFITRELGRDDTLWFETYEPLLGLISVAQGEGLTADQLASIIGHDIRHPLRTSKQYLSGHLPNGPFRIFHQSFVDFLLKEQSNEHFHIDATAMHRRIADYYWLAHHASVSPLKSWLAADPYAHTHLAYHASAAELLDKFVADPLFVIVSDPVSLLRVIDRCASQPAKAYRDVYIRTVLHDLEFSDRASYLELAARRAHEDVIARDIAELPIWRRWRVPWVQSPPGTPYHALGHLPGQLGGLAIIPGTDNRVAVVGRDAEGPWLRILNAQGEIVSRTDLRDIPIAVGITELETGCGLAVLEHRLDMDQRRIEDCGYELVITIWTADDLPQLISTVDLADRPSFTETLRRAAIRSSGGELVAATGDSSWTRVMRLQSQLTGLTQGRTQSIWVVTSPLAITDLDGSPAIVLATDSELNIHVFDTDEISPAPESAQYIKINDDEAWIRHHFFPTLETYATAISVSSPGANYIALGDFEGNTHAFERQSESEELSFLCRLCGTGGEVRHLDILDENGTLSVVSADQSNNLKRWSVVRSGEQADDRLYDVAFFLRTDKAKTYLVERRGSVNNDGSSSNQDRLWTLTGAIGIYDGPDADEATHAYAYRIGLASRHDLVYVDRDVYSLEHHLRLKGQAQLVIIGPSARKIGRPINLARTADIQEPPQGCARDGAHFDLCRLGDALAIIEVDSRSVSLWMLSQGLRAEEPRTEGESWHRQHVFRADSPNEGAALSLIRAYFLSGGADLEFSRLSAITRLAANWTHGSELESEWIAPETIDADKVRMKVLSEELIVAAAGASFLRIFEVPNGEGESSEIASLNVGETIQDLEFADSESVALVTSGGSLVVAFSRTA
jgi:hypothetical protein